MENNDESRLQWTNKVCYLFQLEKRDFIGKTTDLFNKICERVYTEEKLERVFASAKVFKGVVSKIINSRRPKKTRTTQSLPTKNTEDTPDDYSSFYKEREIPKVFSGNEGDGLAFTMGQIRNLGLNPDSY